MDAKRLHEGLLQGCRSSAIAMQSGAALTHGNFIEHRTGGKPQSRFDVTFSKYLTVYLFAIEQRQRTYAAQQQRYQHQLDVLQYSGAL
ncbi:hypothetical protein N7638_09170 [Achromobacter mucicolens]|uniref:hypothetical protein n=1 Tax=Achromobacter mucicolens TaxID=1389922 RepID=UPI0015C7BF54|nr:hypothetical protein [Achromobacter mucicolens]MDG9968198.1 hypothetical protein [Achromobacter mucicolens]WBX91661.1 hypothetical protein PE062_13790 [Achromobacter mucicolens]